MGGAAVVIAIALLTPPVLHDLILGNVMTLYLAAICVALAFPGWIGASGLGTLCAVALKPAVGPFILFLLLRRRGDFARTVAVCSVITAVFAVILGPARYAEYIAAIPALTGLAAPFTGNVGLSSISPVAGIASVVAAYVATLAAARADERVAASVAIAACVIAQPTLGLNYAVLLVPAVLLLWPVSRALALGAAVTAPTGAVLSTVGTTIALIVATIARAVGAARRVASHGDVSSAPVAARADG
jgi:hypothetical protein